MQLKIKQISGLQDIIDTPVSMGLEYSQGFNVSSPSTGNDFETGVLMDYTPFTDSVIQVQVNGLTVEGSYVNKLGAFYFSNDGGITVKSIANLELGDKLYWNGIIKGYQLEAGDIITISYEKEYLSYGGISGSASIPVVSGGGLTGTDYVYVFANGTPEENAIELQAAYDLAKVKVDYQESIQPLVIDGFMYEADWGNYLQMNDYTLFAQSGGPIQDNVVYELLFDGVSYFAYTQYGGMMGWVWTDGIAPPGNGYTTLSILVNTITYNLVTVVVAPGKYSFVSDFLVDTEYISVVSLTGNVDVLFTGVGGINITADEIRVKGIDSLKSPFYIGNLLNLLVIENCKSDHDYAFSCGQNPDTGPMSSKLLDCESGLYSSYPFCGNGQGITGTLINCKALKVYNLGFGSYGSAAGTFINCKSAGIMAHQSTEYGYFYDCENIGPSFSSSNASTSGSFFNCYCLGGDSFGKPQYGYMGFSGRLYFCRCGEIFPTVSGGGRTYYCIDGNGNTNNQ